MCIIFHLNKKLAAQINELCIVLCGKSPPTAHTTPFSNLIPLLAPLPDYITKMWFNSSLFLLVLEPNMSEALNLSTAWHTWSHQNPIHSYILIFMKINLLFLSIYILYSYEKCYLFIYLSIFFFYFTLSSILIHTVGCIFCKFSALTLDCAVFEWNIHSFPPRGEGWSSWNIKDQGLWGLSSRVFAVYNSPDIYTFLIMNGRISMSTAIPVSKRIDIYLNTIYRIFFC